MNLIEKRFLELKQMLSEQGKLLHMNSMLGRAAHAWPERIALICDNESITYENLYKESLHLADFLLKNGIKTNDRVVIIYENSINFYRAYHAAWQANAIVVPLNVYLHEKELEHIIRDCKPRFVIASEHQCKKLTNISIATISPETKIFCEDFFTETSGSEIAHDIKTNQNNDTDDCTIILYTSGTTGLPKGVMLSSNAILTNCLQGISNFDITQEERVYGALPLFHSYMQNAAIWSPTIVGATVIVVSSVTRSALLKGLYHNPTIVLGIPQLFGLFALIKTAPFKKVKLFISGGEALHNKIRMGFELIYNRKITNGYGLTETCPFLAVDIDDARRPSGCIGKILEGIQVEIRDAHTNKVLDHCCEGVLWVKGDNCMLGYYNAPQATAAILQNGWLNTGDIAYQTTDGYIVLCGREKDLIVNKGFKIYPQEIENILTSHNAVMMAAVVGLVHNDTELPVAFVASKQDPTKLIEELKKLCETHLARYKIPVYFYVKHELPMTATGKLDKKALRKELAEMQKPE